MSNLEIQSEIRCGHRGLYTCVRSFLLSLVEYTSTWNSPIIFGQVFDILCYDLDERKQYNERLFVEYFCLRISEFV